MRSCSRIKSHDMGEIQKRNRCLQILHLFTNSQQFSALKLLKCSEDKQLYVQSFYVDSKCRQLQSLSELAPSLSAQRLLPNLAPFSRLFVPPPLRSVFSERVRSIRERNASSIDSESVRPGRNESRRSKTPFPTKSPLSLSRRYYYPKAERLECQGERVNSSIYDPKIAKHNSITEGRSRCHNKAL